ncbi:MAG: sulfotransferase [Candidatus Scalindua sp. AMX11]|nr:MAG: sulfotransferase [Candidatus Scalindua sp.]NOG82550.1 sulfotransferase [Planctomycetota bacterium]RZV93979.1 MAG: sulfotransferase [Candidatus Scalindua sp. SCAELEC01]TDE63978.1 MAG: sulfotransferase [Candidatus Scalindua sp. AMX11]GJQ57455.1 MAG: hypothetical protein SCALA701_02560 [Candidatus Scalindua sp.]
MSTDRFRGPLFVIGMPRSGTKLLRDLLNQNPKIGIPIAESNFIPIMIKRYGNPPQLENATDFQLFYEEYTKTSFFWWMKEFDCVMSKEFLEKNADKKSWASIFEVILRYHVMSGRDKDFIWGDKTPSYLYHIDLLKDLYPKAKFLHILRDPRDCCISAQKAWGTNLFSFADSWHRGVEAAQTSGRPLGDSYMEIYYESLIGDPEKTLTGICEFLGCEFTSAMMQLGRDTENLGDAKGQTKIVSNNKKKYLTELSISKIKRIEEIVYPVMKSTEYGFEYALRHRPLSNIKLKIISRFNKVNRLMFNLKTKGFLEGIKYHFGTLKK